MAKRSGRIDRKERILLSLVEHYIKTGKPVGSNVLQEVGLEDISSATIRNYCASLEEEGYVKQLHSSGGRIPLGKAFHWYAQRASDEMVQEPAQKPLFDLSQKIGVHEVVSILQEAAHILSEKLQSSVVISSPRFDRDSIIDIHFHFLDVRRALAVVISEFGLIHTQVLMPLESLSPALVRKADRFAKALLYKEPLEGELFEPDELTLIRKLYQEAVSSFFVSYSSFSQEDVWKFGFSRLLEYPEFQEAGGLAAPLAFFENTMLIRGLFREVQRQGALRFWVGGDLAPFVPVEPNCAFVAMPYQVGGKNVGSIGVLGPQRMLYKEVFRLLSCMSRELSDLLTNTLIKHRISYRMPESESLLSDVRQLAVDFCSPKLLVHDD